MRKFSYHSINFYQRFISILIKLMLGTSSSCRFTPTCSEYSKRAIMEHGFWRGSVLSFIRILSCQPLGDTVRYNRLRARRYWSIIKERYNDSILY